MFSYNKYIMANTNNANQYTESNSIILNLETLRTTYKNLLIQLTFDTRFLKLNQWRYYNFFLLF